MKEIRNNVISAAVAAVVLLAMALSLVAAAALVCLPAYALTNPADAGEVTPVGESADGNVGGRVGYGYGYGGGMLHGGIMRDGTENSNADGGAGDGSGMGDMTSMDEYTGNVDQGSDGIIGDESEPANETENSAGGAETTKKPAVITTAPGEETTGEDGGVAGGVIGAIIAVAAVVAVIVLVIALLPKRTR